MILRVSQLQPQDIDQLFCSDPRVKREVAREKRRRRRPAEPPAGWVCIEPGTDTTTPSTPRLPN